MKNEGIKVLLIEDDPQLARLIKKLLADYSDPPFDFDCADELSCGLVRISKNRYDVILLDLNLPDSIGLETFSKVYALLPHLPVVILTGTDDEDLALKAVKEGAQDYICKSRMNGELLSRSIRYAVERQQVRTDLESKSQDLSRIEKNFRKVIEKNADGMLVVDQKGIVRFINPAGEFIMDRKKEDILGEMWGLPLVEGEKSEIEVIRKNGTVSAVEIRKVELDWEGERAFLASLRDVTERTLMEKKLREACEELKKLDRMKSQFVSTVSHELRTPLTIVLQTAGNLLDGTFGELTEKQKKWMKEIERSSRRLKDLLNDILDLSKLQSGKVDMRRELFDIGNIIKTVVSNLSTLSKNGGVELTHDIPSDIPKVWGNPSRIQQVVTNLVSNSMKFTPRGGRICVSTQSDKDNILVRVSDAGPGIDAEDLELIFDSFVQIKNDNNSESAKHGIGLGLAICKEIVMQHRGRIWAESEPGKGSQFIFTLPADPRSTPEKPRTILIVDDDEEICEMLKLSLQQEGYQVSVARNGKHAIHLIEDEGISFDLIFSDLMLPGANGVEVMKAVRKLHAKTPVVVITAHPTSDLLLEGMETGPLTIISKPFNLDHIKDVLEKLLPQNKHNILSMRS
ncbi:MAG: response regulator [Elusimicrobia bacterium]|nr:response regulator [Candidatus Obscuribacterium magneticum]